VDSYAPGESAAHAILPYNTNDEGRFQEACFPESIEQKGAPAVLMKKSSD
jgi:hypothetical protein